MLWDRGLLALDVALPPGHRLAPTDVVATYAPVGQALATALRGLGVEARAVGVAEAHGARPEPGSEAALAATACFGGLSPHEVVVGRRKVVGLAQVRRRSGTLIQAGIALRLDASALARLLDPGDARPGALAAALDAHALGLDRLPPRPGAPEVMRAVENVLREHLGVGPLRDDRIDFDGHPPLGYPHLACDG